ncbi:AAA family ATPase [Bradyrhizobium liaoningense]|uniref:AAA family ATPase n=1 Tax=Bradyrhizobium liaoningense TaxID=43992 RepID=UPI001BA4868F|nr:AAA family ATPase [Bradyrhizobium liaoningense]MBR0820269.1 AAA family ATPase [Bradyrhizobium liaoningense]
MISPGGLESLFLTLFPGKPELLRFTRQFLGARISQLIDREESQASTSRRLVRELLERKLVNEKLFDSLVAVRPDRSDVINNVRETTLAAIANDDRNETTRLENRAQPESTTASTVESAPGPSSDEYDREKWRSSLNELFESIPASSNTPVSNWTEAAAVLPHFNPLELRPLGGTSEKDDGLTALAGLSEVRTDGRWTLQLRPRREAIARLWKEKRLPEALKATTKLDRNSAYRSILKSIAKRKKIIINPHADYTWALAAREVAEWFANSEVSPINLDQVSTLLERHETIEPLRKLTGTHFRGRKKELARLRAHQRAQQGTRRVLKITGIGGVGKSTLLGKLLLELEQTKGPPPPWVYLDFDHPEVDPNNPARLIELIARRLGLLYAGGDRAHLFHQLESASAGDTSMAFDIGLGPAASRSELVEALDGVVRQLTLKPSLLLVFDTFEQTQVRGPAVVASFMETIHAILSQLPYARLVISGRGTIEGFSNATSVHLTELDKATALSVLQALGIRSAVTRRRIVQTVGRNPLSLHLSARAIKLKQISVKDLALFAADTQRVQLQGRLYTRVLGHIADSEIRHLAHPGLIVRRITPGVIRKVLADVCGIDPGHADALFARLPEQVSLFTSDNPAPGEPMALRHRQDLRESMLDLMVVDPIWKDRLSGIHSRAIEYYQGRRDPIGRAEELYHRLMRNDPPADLDRLWSDDLINSMSRSWLEPFPERARSWLAIRLGYKVSTPKLRQVDWEAYAQREVRSYLETGNLQAAFKVLSERSRRLPGSVLVPLEIEALRAGGQLEKALTVCLKGLHRIARAQKPDAALQLHLLAAQIGLELARKRIVKQHAERARRLAVSLQDQVAELLALEMLARLDTIGSKGIQGFSTNNLLAIERAFVGTQEDTLRQSPDVATKIVRAVGPQSRQVLKKMATTFNGQPELFRQDAFQMAGLLRQAQAKEGGNLVLGDIASSVGLPSDNFDLQELANNTIRYNYQGNALATLLDAFGEDKDIRSATADLIL